MTPVSRMLEGPMSRTRYQPGRVVVQWITKNKEVRCGFRCLKTDLPLRLKKVPHGGEGQPKEKRGR